MRPLPFAGLLSLAALGAHAQVAAPPFPYTPAAFEPVVVTASRGLAAAPTLRDAIVITREDLEASGSLSLAEVLQRRAGIEVRATGGPGQPQGLFIRGASSAQTLVLVDGLRVGSATVGTTSIENIPVDLVERIEVVKGPLSSLYGSEARGRVIPIFTRGCTVPHLFATASFGTDADRRLAAGVASVDGKSTFAASVGGRRVDAPSATTDRVAFCHDPDRDPYENAFGNLRVTHRMWQGEVLEVEAFATRGRTHFDGCGEGDRNDQTISGARFTSSSDFTRDWSSRVSIGEGRDELQIHGGFPARFETRQTQVAWINEYAIPAGKLVAGYEVLRQRVRSDESTVFAQTERDTRSLFAGINETWGIQRLEASIRRDDDDAFGKRDTGSLGYGYLWPGVGHLSGTWARGFRAPTFYDLYGPSSDFYQPNPALRPEHNKSREISLRGEPIAGVKWRATVFDNQIEDLIAYQFPTVQNVNRARIKGVELGAEGKAWGGSWTAAFTAQKPRDEDTGARLQGRAERFGTFTAERRFGDWSLGLTVTASGDRYDSADASEASRLGGYAVVDLRATWRYSKFSRVELAAVNLADKRYETAMGYEGTRRGILATFRFDAF